MRVRRRRRRSQYRARKRCRAMTVQVRILARRVISASSLFGYYMYRDLRAQLDFIMLGAGGKITKCASIEPVAMCGRQNATCSVIDGRAQNLRAKASESTRSATAVISIFPHQSSSSAAAAAAAAARLLAAAAADAGGDCCFLFFAHSARLSRVGDGPPLCASSLAESELEIFVAEAANVPTVAVKR